LPRSRRTCATGAHSQAWDNKPLIFFTYAGIQSVFDQRLRAASSRRPPSSRQAAVMASAPLYGGRRAIVAGGLFALAMGTPVIEGNWRDRDVP
jgi:hypothetical protein